VPESAGAGSIIGVSKGLSALAAEVAAGGGADRLLLSLLRPEDNLVLTVTGSGLTIDVGDDGVPRLVRRDGVSAASLVVHFPPQHVAEQVYQEQQKGGGHEKPALPAGARFAMPSRLAFDLPAGETIDVTVAGILAAMSRLELLVAPLAAPARVWQLVDGRVTAAPDPLQTIFEGVLGLAASAPMSGGALALDRVRATLVLQESGLGVAARMLDPDLRRAVAAAPVEQRSVAFAAVTAVASGVDRDLIVRLLRNPDPRPPLPAETAIEIPSRLQLSPSSDGGWAHAVDLDDERGGGTGPVELWHTRLGVRDVKDGAVSIDETHSLQRIVRAVWTRDITTWSETPSDVPPHIAFRSSTTPVQRKAFVQLSTGAGQSIFSAPPPVAVNRLALSSLGAFMDVRGVWPPNPTGVLEWQHRATLGRDQYVKVVEDGYLFPFGHRAVLVIETKRKVDPDLPDSADTAILWQRRYLILKERTIGYDQRSMPCTSLTLDPHTTPDLDDPGDDPSMFWPTVGGGLFLFTVNFLDQDAGKQPGKWPLLWVAAKAGVAAADVLTEYGLAKDAKGFKNTKKGDVQVELPLDGRRVAFAPKGPSGEATYETRVLRFAGEPQGSTSTPSLLFAELVIPAVAAATGKKAPVRLTYATPYIASGFDAGANPGEVVLQTARDESAGSFTFDQSDRSGGFLAPGQAIEGVSRRTGPVADPASTALGAVDPKTLFAGFGKLFGLFTLDQILGAALDLDHMPAYKARTLDVVTAIDSHLHRVVALLPAGSPELAAIENAATQFDALAATPAKDFGAAQTAFQTLIDGTLKPAVQGAAAAAGSLDPGQQSILERALDTLTALLDPAPGLPGAAELLAHVARGEPVAQHLDHVHLEWSPPIVKSGDGIFDPASPHGLLLAVDIRGGDLVANPSTDVVAQLTDFTLHLVPAAPLLDIPFKRLLFKASSGSKSDVDVVLDSLAWQGILGFVEKLEQLIPLDGFSDPPSLEVDASGITAGFSLGLPNVAIGVFNLSNLSLGSDLKVPFLGDAPTVGFAFCSRERPFTLAVLFLGGGGFFGLRMNPQGVVLLEASLEFGACLALDFVVASGSVSCMAGVYLRLEKSDGSLTGYLRIRGEVDVLGLISAAIEMYMGLTYEFGSGKVVGQATISVEVEVLCFSESVSISCERKFAGSAGDPTFADAMGPYADEGPWVSYCRAFAA
jgi:hypothetical protein